MRLVKFFKLAKDRNKVTEILTNNVKIDIGMERLAFLILGFILIGHVVACMWILQAKLSTARDTWITVGRF